MLTVHEALAAIQAEVARFPATPIDLPEALGLVLAEDAVSDMDSPPFDKALMDGYAVRAADLWRGQARLRVIEEVHAGQVPQRKVHLGDATRIMTGAPLPSGADAVVPVERTRSQSGPDQEEAVLIDTAPARPGWNVLRQGESMKAGQCVLAAGRQLRSQELGCLAELGKYRVAVYRQPRVAVLATGDELIPVDQKPGPGQIRNSNETMLVAQIQQAGADPVPMGIARDTPDHLRDRIAAGLRHDVLLLSGGVSAGKLDLVPAMLIEAGVRPIFHKVQVKPGQPLWFGVLNKPAQGTEDNRCHVFGLPGNPVSSMVCFEIFARTALRRLMGIEPAVSVPLRAKLENEFVHRGNRPTYHPAKLETLASGLSVRTVPWVGSADLCATKEANAMVIFPEGDRTVPVGTEVDVMPW